MKIFFHVCIGVLFILQVEILGLVWMDKSNEQLWHAQIDLNNKLIEQMAVYD